MTKFLITLSVLCMFCAVLVLGEFDKEAAIADFMSKAGECQKEVKATDADMEEMISPKPETTMEGMCMRACIMKKYGLMNADGKFDKAVAEKHAEMVTGGADDKMKIAHEIIAACAEISVPEDHCKAAHEYVICLKKETEARGAGGSYEM